jgi:hypothetical protein
VLTKVSIFFEDPLPHKIIVLVFSLLTGLHACHAGMILESTNMSLPVVVVVNIKFHGNLSVQHYMLSLQVRMCTRARTHTHTHTHTVRAYCVLMKQRTREIKNELL